MDVVLMRGTGGQMLVPSGEHSKCLDWCLERVPAFCVSSCGPSVARPTLDGLP